MTKTKTIGDRIAAARHAAGKTLQEVADAYGCSPQVISSWERGKCSPKGADAGSILRLADAIGCDVAEFADAELVRRIRDGG